MAANGEQRVNPTDRWEDSPAIPPGRPLECASRFCSMKKSTFETPSSKVLVGEPAETRTSLACLAVGLWSPGTRSGPLPTTAYGDRPPKYPRHANAELREPTPDGLTKQTYSAWVTLPLDGPNGGVSRKKWHLTVRPLVLSYLGPSILIDDAGLLFYNLVCQSPRYSG